MIAPRQREALQFSVSVKGNVKILVQPLVLPGRRSLCLPISRRVEFELSSILFIINKYPEMVSRSMIII
jgi:hypothetical protein